LLWEICQRIGFNPNIESSIPRCLEYIIKDLYDTLMSESEVEEIKPKKEVKPEEVMEYIKVRIPPPPP
jgi:hypothetical protein